jgi:beta-phosphoglucomutase-like phosphatase (HAD superfamily)
MFKAVILDFDGTLVSTDILTLLCGLNGNARESDELMERYFSGDLQAFRVWSSASIS